MAWEMLAGQAQGSAYHQRQDIPVISVGHPLRGSPVGCSTRCHGGSTASSMLAAGAGSGAIISSWPRLIASSLDANSQAGDHVALRSHSVAAHIRGSLHCCSAR